MMKQENAESHQEVLRTMTERLQVIGEKIAELIEKKKELEEALHGERQTNQMIRATMQLQKEELDGIRDILLETFDLDKERYKDVSVYQIAVAAASKYNKKKLDMRHSDSGDEVLLKVKRRYSVEFEDGTHINLGAYTDEEALERAALQYPGVKVKKLWRI